MSDIDTFERLRRVHKNDQQFAQIALLPAEKIVEKVLKRLKK